MGPKPHLWFFCIQNRDFRTRIAGLYGSQPSSLVFACKAVTFGSELQRSMSPIPHLWLFACKTAWLAPELLVSMGPTPHLWFLHAKQRLLDQNCKSLWVPAFICGFCMQNRDLMTRINGLYGHQTSPVLLCIQNSAISNRFTSLNGSQTSPAVLCMKNNVISIRINSLYGSQPSFVVFECKTAPLGPELQVPMGPNPHLWFLHQKQRL